MHKALLILALAAAMPILAQEEMIAFGVDEFTNCGNNDLWYSRGFADRFADAFKDKRDDGLWDSALLKFDGATDGEDFTDRSKDPVNGEDHLNALGLDHADVGFLSSHGGAAWAGDNSHVFTSFVMGENFINGCSVNTTDHMLLGDDQEIFVAATCQSAQLSAFTSGGLAKARKSGSKFHTWLGFHGLSYDSLTDRNHVRIYAKNSFNDGLGYNWVVGLTRGRGLSPDQCATAVVRGSNSAGIATNFEYGGFRDRSKYGTNAAVAYWYIPRCNPADGPKLPN